MGFVGFRADTMPTIGCFCPEDGVTVEGGERRDKRRPAYVHGVHALLNVCSRDGMKRTLSRGIWVELGSKGVVHVASMAWLGLLRTYSYRHSAVS